MINIKNQEELKLMEHAGKILSETMWEILRFARAGVSELEIDALAEKLIREKGGEPGFKLVDGYKHTICISLNDGCVHGIPTDRKLKEGDKIGIDCGAYYKGFHSDMSETILVSAQNLKLKTQNLDVVEKFLGVGKEALNAGIKEAVVGNRVWHISKAIQDIVEAQNGYSIVRSLVGHGVGRELHEDPEIPGYIYGRSSGSPELKEGVVIAIEVIYNMGGPDLVLDDDGWTLRTKDGKLSGLFERTVAITKNGPKILTP
jgi:methionyl aminopeptidase